MTRHRHSFLPAALLTLLLSSLTAGPALAAGFTGDADPSQFSVANTGTLLGDPASAGTAQFSPTALVLTSSTSAGGCDGGVYSVTGPCELLVRLGPLASAGTVQFHWAYSTADVDGPAGDMFSLLVDGQRTTLSDLGGAVVQEGDVSIVATQSFGWALNCTDCTGGTATVTVSNFSLSPGPEPAGWALMLAGAASLAALQRRRARRA